MHFVAELKFKIIFSGKVLKPVSGLLKFEVWMISKQKSVLHKAEP